MKITLLSITSVLCILQVFSQPTVKQWDSRFGGTVVELLYAVQKTADGGYILGGWSSSGISGDKTQPNWDTSLQMGDYWIVKIDSNGNKLWDKRFGGSGQDGLYALQVTTDGGCIAGGRSYSGMEGDKSEISRGSGDYWVVKVDANGNKQWDKTFGGSEDDELYGGLQQTSDGGYIIGGYSFSGIGGDKTEPNRGSTFYADYWVIKTDSLGNKVWDKTFGGDKMDDLISVLQTEDGGYLLGGYSMSGISGDKTSPQIGSWDWWVVKIDSLGNKIWDRTYGTVSSDKLRTIVKTHDDNYIIAGLGFYFIKIDNNGGTLWQKSFSGCAGINSIIITSDNGYLLAGTADVFCSGGPIYRDKSEANLGPVQTWLVKTDSAFNKQWDKTIFSTGEDLEGRAVEAENGCYVIACYSGSGIGGYKSQPSWGGSDYWVVKLCEDSMLSANNLIQENEIGIAIYPNPFVNALAITLQKENLREATFAITTIEGKIIYTQHETQLANRYTKILDLSPLPNGVYLVTVSIEGERVVKRIIKE